MQNFNVDKIIVAPQIVIYKGLLKDSNDVLETFKKSQLEHDSDSYFPEWHEWNPTHNTFGKMLTVRTIDNSMKINDYDSEICKEQKKLAHKIYEAFNFVKEDFLKDWLGKGIWPEEITNWDTSNTEYWQNHDFNVISYTEIDKKYIHDPSSGQYNLALDYHVDAFPGTKHHEGPRLTLTITMYLNDDYENGEISFYSDLDNQVYNYKPRPGDITVFPSYYPFYHGVLPMKGNPRYLIRSFLLYNYEGSKEWHKEKHKYSREEWDVIKQKKIEDAKNSREHCVRILFEGDVSHDKIHKPIFVKNKPNRIE